MRDHSGQAPAYFGFGCPSRSGRMWALSRFIEKKGGLLISSPNEQWVRMEVPEDSKLPDELFELGYELRYSGANSRITAQGFTPVDCYTFRIIRWRNKS